MSQRTPEHERETASSRRFKGVLPNAWVVRDQTPDYGIDYVVEIFDEGESTGEVFGVQLRSTGTLGEAPPKARLRVSRRQYWSSFPFPVLVVLWVEDTDSLWWRWVHHYDPWQEEADQRSFTIEFPIENDLTSHTAPAELRHEVRSWRAWNAGAIPHPIDLKVTIDGDSYPLTYSSIASSLRSRLAPSSHIINLAHEPNTFPYFTLTVSEEKTVLWAAGGSSTTLHHEDGGLPGPQDNIDDWAADVVLTIGLRLVRFGADGIGTRLASGVCAEATAILDPQIAFETTQSLAQHDYIDEVIVVLQRLGAIDLTEAGFAAASALIHPSTTMSDSGRRRIGDLYLEWSESAHSSGHSDVAARLTYNSAKVLVEYDPGRACVLLERAAEYDPTYRDRDYWWRELGGARFVSGDYEGAIAAYRTATDLGSDQAVPRLADSLLLNGELAESHDVFSEVVDDQSLSRPEWRLKFYLLKRVLERNDVDEDEGSTCEIHSEFSAAITEAKPDPESFFNYGRERMERDEPSFLLFLGAALFAENWVPAWGCALITCTQEAPRFGPDVASCALRLTEGRIRDFFIDAPVSEELVSQVQQWLTQAEPPPPVRAQIRAVDPATGEYVSIPIGERDGLSAGGDIETDGENMHDANEDSGRHAAE